MSTELLSASVTADVAHGASSCSRFDCPSYSNSQKYISLFAASSTEQEESTEDRHLTLPTHLQPTTTKKSKKSSSKSNDSAESSELDITTAKRLELLQRVEGLMKSGELSGEPEKDKDGRKARGGVLSVGLGKKEEEKVQDVKVVDGGEAEKKKDKALPIVEDGEDDDFFE